MSNPAALLAAVNGDLANAIAASTPGGIEAQEAAGQRAMVAASQLPKDGCDRDLLSRLGFTFGADVDDLFVSATLPAGWTLRPTEHSMHTDIVDAQGRKRGGIFYKAAFYDRKAHMRMAPRFHVDAYSSFDSEGNEVSYEEGYSRATHRAVVVRDCGAIVYRSALLADAHDKAFFDLLSQREETAKAWLAENYPDHKNVEAYWDA